MNKIRAKLAGRSKVECAGRDYVRLINICSYRGITTWRERRKDENNTRNFYIYSRDRNTLEEIAAKCGMTVSITESRGYLGTVLQTKKKLSFIAGIIFFMTVIYTESLYVWHVEIEGAESYTYEEIYNMIELEYPCVGVRKKDIDTEVLTDMLMDNFEDICWASCSVNGTKLTVHLKESVDVFTDISESRPCNIVSSIDCTVYSIVTASGTPVAIAGDEVKKGDILISGTVNICNDDSEVVDTRYVAANGEVYGVAKLQYSDEISSVHYRKIKTDEKLTGLSIAAGSHVFELPLKNLDGDNCDITSETFNVHIGNLYFPLSYTARTATTYEVETEIYDEVKMRELADEHLQTYIAKLQEKGVQIQQKNVIISSGQNGITASGSVTVRLPIGIPDVLSLGDMAVTEDDAENSE